MGPENKVEFTGETLYIGDCTMKYKVNRLVVRIKKHLHITSPNGRY